MLDVLIATINAKFSESLLILHGKFIQLTQLYHTFSRLTFSVTDFTKSVDSFDLFSHTP